MRSPPYRVISGEVGFHCAERDAVFIATIICDQVVPGLLIQRGFPNISHKSREFLKIQPLLHGDIILAENVLQDTWSVHQGSGA